MPQGNREFLKADTKDGYTKIANLLLEALALARLSGVQKGICLYLWRRTYGWGVEEDGITLREFAQACGTSESYVSRQIKQLVNWNIIIRTSHAAGKVATYTFNTRVAQWDRGCLDIQGLKACATQGLYKCRAQGLHGCARANQAPAQENQAPGPPLKKEEKKIKEINTAADAREDKNIYIIFERELGRPLSPMEVEQIQYWMDRYNAQLVTEALKRAVLQGKTTMQYMGGILSAWHQSNVQTLQDVERQDIEFAKRKTGGKAYGKRSPPAPDPLSEFIIT